VVLQQEIPAAANLALAMRARTAGARLILNAAPARTVESALLDLVDVLVVNAAEMRSLATTSNLPAEPAAFAGAFVRRYGGMVVVTLGAEGIVAAEPGAGHALRAPSVTIADTTGAGDAFVGALAAALERGLKTGAALAWGVAAGSLACTKHGAQPALPHAAEIAPVAATLEANAVIRNA